ncbi:hypothetical protein [Bradyrhizobium sp. cf659]|uniref:hypothetical protein n=1 Tax=Bradyrhizobium sp. cf659 TaxID=1761771 RepID=UPI0008F0E328|nr:hypothetical protein [Bradyrhizobium sp. cf659]SFH84158.1 hypothetical protein SAMN04487925_101735 [Bradyrhizobium sp. cf659]
MACLSKEAADILTNRNEAELQTAIETHHETLLKQRADCVDYGKPEELTPKKNARLNCELLKQVLIHRADQLVTASSTMLAEKNLYGLSLVVRGHIESMAILGYFTRRLQSLKAGNITFETFEQDIRNGLMGAKHNLFELGNCPVNILTCVQHTDKYLDAEFFHEKKEMVEDIYGWLSEFAHPNFCSNKTAFTVDKENNRMVLRKEQELTEDHIQAMRNLRISSELFNWLLTAFDERVKEDLSE